MFARRASLLAVLAVSSLVFGGCAKNNAFERLAMPDPASAQGEHTLRLWQGAWIAAFAVGIVVWGLIAYVVIRFRRKSPDEIPVQTRYNLPLEIFYTIAPLVMVIVLFNHTVKTQDVVLHDTACPTNIMEITGERWDWTFNYGLGAKDCSADDDRFDSHYSYGQYVYEGGTGSYIPTIYLPVGVTTRFNLHSPDVIHDFGVPAFLMKMDVIPGRVNHYEIKPTRIGVYKGKCYELCGTFHSRMLFEVHVVSMADYQQHLAELQAAGQVSNAPLLGGADAYTQAGLASEDQGGSQ